MVPYCSMRKKCAIIQQTFQIHNNFCNHNLDYFRYCKISRNNLGVCMEKIDGKIYSNIKNQLKKIEKDNNIEILYAVESGSRGWGFPNSESDYDIRFIFKRDMNDYLTITPINDTIDYFDDKLDFVGWDIKKVLYLHRKSNPNLREWMKQSIVYYGDCAFLENLPPFNISTLKHHYASIAYKNWKRFRVSENKELTKKITKSYLYMIRCCLTWIILDETNDSPLQIDELLSYFKNRMNSTLLNDINSLINFYRSNCEANYIDDSTMKNINEFIVSRINIMNQEVNDKKTLPDIEIYDKKFREIIKY